ncbi:related to protoporphyrinogen oxidase [Cephalotrichum gorgonifer]|uniref:Related to protoporphyrinogen oxidase n=1 Tax=Cephalotrichum gorgonifer TaxID=2041049 RepID=A0AAE8N7G8_9PEZI|nr:related to protoporphyrinogen oxidase [Cephalotrichum gorgonifer]
MPSYVVTGASRGLGYGFVKVLAANPSNTVIGIARNRKSTEERLAADGITNVHVLAADITEEGAMKVAAQEAKRILGAKGLDVLINNAGYISKATELKSVKEMEGNMQELIDDTQKSFDINVFGTIKAVFAFLPLIREGGLKKVVAISSGMGDLDLINESKLSNAAPYSTSKAAISTFFAKLAASYEEDGILFMSLCPGRVDTSQEDGETSPLSGEDVVRLEAITAKSLKYAAPDFRAVQPEEGAQRCLAAIDRSSLEGGFGGTLLSYNGTKRWM